MSNLRLIPKCILKIGVRVATRGGKHSTGLFETEERDSKAIGPLKRKTERPPTPGGVAGAIIVSFPTTKTKQRSLLQQEGEDVL